MVVSNLFCSPLFWEDFQFHSYFFRWVGSSSNSKPLVQLTFVGVMALSKSFWKRCPFRSCALSCLTGGLASGASITKAELIENIDALSKISSELKPLPEAQGVGFRWCGGPRFPQRACVERTTVAREGGASRTEAVLGNL